jgi:hypothetical protein
MECNGMGMNALSRIASISIYNIIYKLCMWVV